MQTLTPETISWMNQLFTKSWIFGINPEKSHRVAMRVSDTLEKLDFLLDWFNIEDKRLQVEIWPMTLKNSVVLSAWFLKQSVWLKFWEKFWFGGLTIWWFTPKPQKWNMLVWSSKTRIWRFDNINSIVNALWLNNDWIEVEADRLAKRKKSWNMPNVPLIANLCNNSNTVMQYNKIEEYKYMIEKLYNLVDAFEINISCPNQKWVCDLQNHKKYLKDLLSKIIQHNEYLARKNKTERKAIIVKISPLTKYIEQPEKIQDLTLEWLWIIVSICNKLWIDWITATNTSKEHDFENTKVQTSNFDFVRWWISWEAIKNQSLETVKKLKEVLDLKIPIVWVWWIGYDDWQSWVNMKKAWASWIWILSSFVQSKWWVLVPKKLNEAILTCKKN